MQKQERNAKNIWTILNSREEYVSDKLEEWNHIKDSVWSTDDEESEETDTRPESVYYFMDTRECLQIWEHDLACDHEKWNLVRKDLRNADDERRTMEVQIVMADGICSKILKRQVQSGGKLTTNPQIFWR